MAQAPPPVGSNNSPGTNQPLIPPDESLWQRYSPHYELPVSLSASAAIHAVVAALGIFGVLGALLYVFRPNEEPPPYDGDIVLVGGGGGNPEGVGRGPGDGNPLAGRNQKEAQDDRPEDDKQRQEDVKFEPVQIDREKFDFEVPDPETKKMFDNPTEAIKRLEKVHEDVRKALVQGPPAGKGEGGPGRDGGKDKGRDTGKGDQRGPGEAKVANRRAKRALRWTMIFDTDRQNTYRAQLADLGATVAIPLPGEGKEFMVFRDLRNPAGKKEDIRQIKQIYWVDDKADSVQSLAQELGLDLAPPYIVAFFPIELENKLAKLEENYRGRKEEEIQETRFRIFPRGGRYEPVVVGQR